MIEGELTLNNEGSQKQSLRRGEKKRGGALIQDATKQSELIGIIERANVLLFAMA